MLREWQVFHIEVNINNNHEQQYCSPNCMDDFAPRTTYTCNSVWIFLMPQSKSMILSKTDLSCSFPSIPPDYPSITRRCPSGYAASSLCIVCPYVSPPCNVARFGQHQQTQRPQNFIPLTVRGAYVQPLASIME